MTDSQFESLVDAMLDDAKPDLQAELRQFCVDEVFKMAPLIDNMTRQAFIAGQFQGMLTLLAAQKERRKELAASVPF